MKRILSKGSTSKYRAKCPYCDCEFEYQFSDTYHGYFGPSYQDKTYVDCPYCYRVLFHSDSSSTCTRLSTESL